jgi:hypothetical protein
MATIIAPKQTQQQSTHEAVLQESDAGVHAALSMLVVHLATSCILNAFFLPILRCPRTCSSSSH